MMYTVANLLVAGIADKKGALNCVFLNEDGSTFATDRMCLLIVEPCKSNDDDFKVVGVEPIPVRKGGIAVPANLIIDTIKAIPKQPLRRVHANAALTSCGTVVEFATTKDGISATKNSSMRTRSALPKVNDFLQSIGERKASAYISLKRLKKLVDSLDKMCGGDEKQPVRIGIGENENDPISLRVRSYLTGQRIIGTITPAKDTEELNRLNKWERKLLDKGVQKKQVSRKGEKRTARRRHR